MVVPCAIQSSSRSTSIQQWLPHCSASVSAGVSLKALVPALRSRIFSPSKILNTEARMAKPPSLMIAIGLPGHHGEQADEDNLNREQDGEGGDDLATEAIMSIVNRLHHGKASAVRDLRAFTAALEALCEAFMARDYHAVGDAASDARDALHDLISE